MIRYDFVPNGSHVRARLHAFLHKQTASATAVTGWFEVEDDDAMLTGPVDGADGRAEITGDLSIGGRTETITATAMVRRNGDRIAIQGSWPLSQRQFGLTRPAGVKDRVDIDFTLVAQRGS